MQEIYASAFHVKASFDELKAFIMERWARFAAGTGQPAASRSDGREARIWTLSSESTPQDLRHECRLVQVRETIEARFSIATGLLETAITRHDVIAASPDLVLDVLDQFECNVGNTRVVSHAEDVGVSEIPQFRDLVFDKKRRIPVVVLSHHLQFNELLVDAATLAPDLAGLARVYVLKNDRTTLAWSDAVGGKEWGVFNGAARIYWPDFHLKSSIHHHRLFLMEYAVPGENEVQANLIKQPIVKAVIAASRETPILLEARRILHQEMRQHIKTLGVDELRRQAEQLAEENERLRERIEILGPEGLRRQVEDLTGQVEVLQRELEGTKQRAVAAYVEAGRGRSKTTEIQRHLKSAKTCTDILHLSSQVHDRLWILPSAWKGADGVKSKHLDELWTTLYLLNELGLDLERRGAEFGSTWGPYFAESATRLAVRLPRFANSDSKGTIDRFGDKRTFPVDGHGSILFRKHFTLGDADPEGCLQVYWEILDGRVVIGYVGLHLPYITAA